MYSLKEASQKLVISDDYCRWLLERGRIKGKKLGHDWVVLSLDYKRKRKPKRRAEQGEKLSGIPKLITLKKLSNCLTKK